MPFKHNSARRHRIAQQKFKVINWAEYKSGFRHCGSLTIWISETAIAGWIAPQRKTRGGQRYYSDLAIETTLMWGKVFNQPLPQTAGLMTSLLMLLNVELPNARFTADGAYDNEKRIKLYAVIAPVCASLFRHV